MPAAQDLPLGVQPLALLSEATGGRLERALRYREVCGPAGQDYKLRGVFTSNRELWGAINLWRERGRSDFSACEVAFFDGLPRIWAPV